MKAETVRWIEQHVHPDIYAVATLKQAVGIHVDHKKCWGHKTWIRGDINRYSAAYDQFIRRLSRRVYGRKTYRRHRKLLPNAATLEGSRTGTGVRYHLNIMVRRPELIPFWYFKAMFEKEWLRSDWAMPDVMIKERTGDCISYSLKEGLETLLICG